MSRVDQTMIALDIISSVNSILSTVNLDRISTINSVLSTVNSILDYEYRNCPLITLCYQWTMYKSCIEDTKASIQDLRSSDSIDITLKTTFKNNLLKVDAYVHRLVVISNCMSKYMRTNRPLIDVCLKLLEVSFLYWDNDY